MRNNHWFKIGILLAIAIIFAFLTLFYDIKGPFHWAFPRRLVKLGALIITAVAIAYSTVIFQTITRNRILTPSVMGLDSMYQVVQTIIFFFAGSTSFFVVNKFVNFGISLVSMVGFALLLYVFLFRADKYPIYLLLLIGMVVGTLLGSLVSFLQVMIDPNEYLSLQGKLFASFYNVKSELLYIAITIIAIVIIIGIPLMKKLDVMSLGRENAISLGINYDQMVLTCLILSAILIATATALVGPITFLGLIVANLAYQYIPSYKHSVLITAASVISVLALVGGQFIVEHVLSLSTTISVIINFIGGIYFIYLLLKESRAAG